MADWKAEVDRSWTYQRADVLKDKGRVSRQSVNAKIKDDYQKYQQNHHEITKLSSKN